MNKKYRDPSFGPNNTSLFTSKFHSLSIKRNNIIITCITIPRSHLINLIIIIYKLTKTFIC